MNYVAISSESAMSVNENDGPRVWVQGARREVDRLQLAEAQLFNDLNRSVDMVAKILEDNNLNSTTCVKDVSSYVYIGFSVGRKRTVRFESADLPFHFKLRVHRTSGLVTKKGHSESLGHIFRLSYDDVVKLSAHVT